MKTVYVRLPFEFTDLLKSNMNTKGDGFKKLKTNYWNQGSMKTVISLSFQTIDKQGRFDRILHSLGWLGLRDRMASSYIQYLHEGHFPADPNQDYVKDILYLEDVLKPYTIDGHNRGFLLGFYLKMAMTSKGKKFKNNWSITSEALSLLDLGSSKLLNIDWLCLTLQLALNYKKHDYLASELKAGASFSDIYNDLPLKERTHLLYDLTTYGSSIFEQEMFYSKVV